MKDDKLQYIGDIDRELQCSKGELDGEICAAFPVRPIPSSSTAFPFTADEGEGSEAHDISTAFGMTTWDRIPLAVLKREVVSFAIASAKGFQYYLPAFLRISLCETGSDGYWITSHMLDGLDPAVVGADSVASTVSCLSEPQRKIVIKYLRHLRRFVADEKMWPGVDRARHFLETLWKDGSGTESV